MATQMYIRALKRQLDGCVETLLETQAAIDVEIGNEGSLYPENVPDWTGLARKIQHMKKLIADIEPNLPEVT